MTTLQMIEEIGRLRREKEKAHVAISKACVFLKAAQEYLHPVCNVNDVGTAYILVSASIIHLEGIQ